MSVRRFSCTVVVTALALAGLAQATLACTTIIAGKNATADGSILVARLEDYTFNNHAKHFVVVPRIEHKAGDMLSFDNGVRVPAPAVSQRYTAMRDWNGAQFGAGGQWSEFGSNEAGVVLSATNSTEQNERAAKAAPLVADGGGVVEAILPDLILPQARSAREAVALLGRYVETLGAGETNGIEIADANEAWLFEIGGGHQWIAVRVPDDGYLTIANGMRVHDVDLGDSRNVLASPGLAAFVSEHKLLDRVDPQRFNFAKAFGKIGDSYNVDREWLVQSRLTPSSKQPVRQAQYPFYTRADRKIDVATVASILRTADYAGTPLDKRKPAAGSTQRPIAVDRNVEAHIIQVRPDMPKELQVLSWQSMGNVRDAVFLPFYLGAMQSTPQVFRQGNDDFDSHSAWWTFRSVSSLANANPGKYRPLITGWRDRLEANLRAAQPATDAMLKSLYGQNRELAINYAQRLGNGTALYALDQARELRDTLMTDLTKSTELKYTPAELDKIKGL